MGGGDKAGSQHFEHPHTSSLWVRMGHWEYSIISYFLQFSSLCDVPSDLNEDTKDVSSQTPEAQDVLTWLIYDPKLASHMELPAPNQHSEI